MSLRSFALAAAIPLLLAIATLVAQSPDGPVLYADEMGYLAIGVELSTRDAAPSLDELEFYSPGYGALLAPVLSVTDADPWVVAVGANLVAVALLGPALLILVREVFAPPPVHALLAAIAGASTPSTIAQVSRAWPECLLALLAVVWAITLHRVIARAGRIHGPLLVVTALASFVVHRRGAVLLLVSGAVLVLHHGIGLARARGRVRDLWPELAWAASTAVLAAVGIAAASRFDQAIKSRLYEGADLVNATERVSELAGEDLVPRAAAALWSLTHATFGLALVAGIVLVAMVAKGCERAWAAGMLATVGGATALSVVVIADGPRVDHLLYERYVAPLLVIVVAVAIVGIARLPRHPALVAATLLALPVATLTTTWVTGPDAFEGDVQKLTVPTLSTLSLVSGGAGDVFIPEIRLWPITILVTAFLAAVIGVARRWPSVAGGLTTVAFAAALVVGGALSFRPNLDFWEGYARSLSDGIEASGTAAGPFGAADGAPDGVMIVLQHRFGYPPVVQLDGDGCPAVPVVVGPEGFSPPYPATVVAESSLPPGSLVTPDCG